jgi:phosphoglycerate dehydrogenase-like enzyme
VKIVSTSPSFSKNRVLQNEMTKSFPGVKLNLDGVKFSKSELIEYIRDADGLILGLEEVDREVLDQCPNLRFISKYGVGLNNIDLDACKEKNIGIGWTGGVNKLSAAEMTIGFMMMLSRNLFVTSNALKAGIWDKNGGFQLTGKTIGIIGVGHIGKELIRLLEPFKCKILVNDILDQSEYYQEKNLKEVSKKEMYLTSDIITIHTPYTDITNNMINLEVLKIMKKTAYILNTARGGIINEVDLKYALQNNIIAGAAIDSYEEEPPTDSELLKLENLITTPHIGGNSKEAVEAMGMSAINHLKVFFNK